MKKLSIAGLVLRASVFAVMALLAGCASQPTGGFERIDYIVVIYAENRSFDHLYGLFPGAEGIAQATAEQKTQLDHDGRPLPHLPPVYEHGKPDPHFPSVAGFRTARSASTRRRSTAAWTRCCRAAGTSTTRTASRSMAAGTTCSSPCRTSAAG